VCAGRDPGHPAGGRCLRHALVQQHRIDAKRLSARGVASFAPVASNAAEAGRAKNRRVAMVAQ
jgi:OOP family OmpA-OmpF porin